MKDIDKLLENYDKDKVKKEKKGRESED